MASEELPEVVIRVAGLRFRVVDDLRSCRAWSSVQSTLSLEERLTRLGGKLADSLYEVIAQHPDSTAKPLLVGLRRAVHNGRAPSTRTRSAAVLDVLSKQLRKELAEWSRLRERRQAAVAELPSLLAADAHDNENRLRKWAREPEFSTTLADVKPRLADELLNLGLQDGLAPATAMRLVKYLARAGAKTSPFGAFMITGLVQWQQISALISPKGVWSWQIVVEPDLDLLERLALSQCEPPALRANVSLTEHEERAWYVQAGWNERVIGVVVNDGVRAAMAGRPGRLRDRLSELGLLEPVPAYRDQERDPLAVLISRSAQSPRLAELRRLRRTFSEYARVRSAVDRLPLRLDMERVVSDIAPDLVRGTARRNLVHTSAVFNAGPVSVGIDEWVPVLGDLDVIRRFLGPFRTSAVIDAIAPEVCARLDGAGHALPFLVFYRELLTLFRSPEPGSATDQLKQLLHAVGASAVRLPTLPGPADSVRSIRVQGTKALQERRVEESEGHMIRIAELMDLMKDWTGRAASAVTSMACFVQVAGRGRVVLNGIGPGHGAVAARTRWLQGKVAATAAGQPGRGPLFAEIAGTFSSTLNSRTSSVPYEIIYPGAVGTRETGYRLHLADLIVRIEKDCVTLRRRSDGSRVIPVHTGMMSPALLPAAARMLYQLFGDDPRLEAPLRVILGSSPERAPSCVEHYRRLSIGSVVVARASWWVPRRLLPRRERTDRAGHLLRLARTFSEHGIPEESYVSVHSLTATGLGRRGKPMYLNLANQYLVHALDLLTSDEDATLCFEECLPSPRLGVPFGNGERRVSELAFDVGG